jgi:hypothetical protein
MNQEPQNGDFASQLEKLAQKPAFAPAATAFTGASTETTHADNQDTGGYAPITFEMAAEIAMTLGSQPPMCEDELARQALAHPGADGDTTTPE